MADSPSQIDALFTVTIGSESADNVKWIIESQPFCVCRASKYVPAVLRIVPLKLKVVPMQNESVINVLKTGSILSPIVSASEQPFWSKTVADYCPPVETVTVDKMDPLDHN